MYAVIGANGYLGAYVLKTILEQTEDNILAVDMNIINPMVHERIRWHSCNVSSLAEIENLNKVMSEDTYKVIYLAAYHHPDKVKKNPHLAWNINITSLSAFVNCIENIYCFFYPSTEMVYGSGESGNRFTENHRLHPVNLYGKQKVVAESIVNGYGYNVVRFPFLIGTSLLLGKSHFYDEIVQTLKEKKTMEMFCDAMKSPLDFGTAASILIKLVENYSEDLPKILNISGDEDLTKYDIGLRIADKIGCSKELVVPISMSKDKKIFTEKRANCTLLDNSLVKKFLGLDNLKMNL